MNVLEKFKVMFEIEQIVEAWATPHDPILNSECVREMVLITDAKLEQGEEIEVAYRVYQGLGVSSTMEIEPKIVVVEKDFCSHTDDDFVQEGLSCFYTSENGFTEHVIEKNK